MGLQSALTTALTGLSAAETQIDVIGNNLANAQTVGFKSSDAVFATQFLQTLSLGAGPSANNGGTNPRQIGLGVQVAEIAANHNQGTIEISSSSSDLAIQGDGFFQVEAADGEKLYTRNGIFKLNSDAELVNATGQRLLGYGIDEQFRLQTSELVPLSVPLGTKTVAKATENVSFEGTLTPEGDVATAAQVIESLHLGDSQVPQPDATGVSIETAPIADSVTVSGTVGAGSLAAGTYQYRFSLVDASGNESAPSSARSFNVGANGNVDFSNLPADPTGGDYPTVNIYRTGPNGSDFEFLASAAAGGTYNDDGSVPLSGTPLNEDTLTGNYTYMITYYSSGDPESRPSSFLGPKSVVDGRITLSDFPTPPTPPAGGGFPAYDSIRIYRNLAGDQNNFYLVGEVAPGDTFTDSATDADISDLTDPSNQLLDMNGPAVNSNTLLTDVLKRDGLTYENVFSEGTLSYTGRKGGRTLGTKELEITDTTTMQDLLDFLSDASGIQTSQVDSANPIPRSDNNIEGETGDLVAGAYIQDGRIRLVSNNGEANAVDIELSAFRLEDEFGQVTTPNLAFGTQQEAIGQSASSDFVVYDSLGVPINVRVSATLESRTDQATIYRWYADSPDNSVPGSTDITVGTGLIQFDGNGNFVTATEETISINRQGIPSVSPLQFEMDFSLVSGLATEEATLAATQQDGSEPGVLNSFIVGEDGTLRGVFSNGISRDLGQLQLARFANPAGLEARGLNLYAEGVNTGLPVTGQPGENGIGTVIGGALELSNTDIGKDLVELVLASTQYRGNSRVITTTQQLIDELLNLRR
ncbi:flagellar hook-basal body complex protein [Rhodopirellula sp. JC740]|uniref:Flagellar hook protein FlgE n=1 Tax=Rhodopirellula halodulae TaxID=2894198 RepID=A0ABS8NR85_9BACT|nr:MULTISPECIES: flagellar hook-basal body complex protein [unclassified Rhodopirellula]MCC9645328.1 flagellar hook-basal body complex protein [Rhodopirellula sp. JC740]MCC9655730.1 flagellar hook-basal body complex protein [Rhodopirellula sp. JC737]